MIFETHTAQESRDLGAKLGRLLRAGDIVLLDGPLGAGKTTFTQGIAAGMGVEGRVTSPTFIVSRVHDSASDGPPLVHVDAYRIDDASDLETLDLDTSLPESVTVVEWGADKVEALSDTRLVITFEGRASNDWAEAGDEMRLISFKGVGGDWAARLELLEEEERNA